MLEFKAKRKRRDIVQPQLVAMLDICSLITVFLLAGSVFGPEGLVIPPGVGLARSVSVAVPPMAPQIIVTELGVDVPFLKQTFNFEVFESVRRHSPRAEKLREQIRAYLKTETAQAATESLTLNVIADKRIRYDVLYDVIALFREGGFEGVSFIAMSEGH